MSRGKWKNYRHLTSVRVLGLHVELHAEALRSPLSHAATTVVSKVPLQCSHVGKQRVNTTCWTTGCRIVQGALCHLFLLSYLSWENTFFQASQILRRRGAKNRAAKHKLSLLHFTFAASATRSFKILLAHLPFLFQSWPFWCVVQNYRELTSLAYTPIPYLILKVVLCFCIFTSQVSQVPALPLRIAKTLSWNDLLP